MEISESNATEFARLIKLKIERKQSRLKCDLLRWLNKHQDEVSEWPDKVAEHVLLMFDAFATEIAFFAKGDTPGEIDKRYLDLLKHEYQRLMREAAAQFLAPGVTDCGSADRVLSLTSANLLERIQDFLHSVGVVLVEQALHELMNPPPMEDGRDVQGFSKTRGAKNRVRRNARYQAIDNALQEIATARPRNHEEVFRCLHDRKIAIPNRKPFKAAGGWLKGFQKDRPSACTWLSQAWSRLGLPAFAPGPKK